jgi:hypothetical protein
VAPPVISLTTDFGIRDAYVGAMKGVILGICPDARLVDITHEIPPQDVRAGALLLAEAAPFFPEGVIHLGVVDPGVGSQRRAIAVQTARAVYVGPDNGIFHLCLERDGGVRRAVELQSARHRLREVTSTFHGRDVFAPAAAHIACGVDLTELGPPVEGLARLELRAPTVAPGYVRGEVVRVDRFGNLVTNLRASDLPAGVRRVEIGFAVIDGISRTYADVTPGALLALLGSGGFLEISVRDGSASERLGLGAAAAVVARA